MIVAAILAVALSYRVVPLACTPSGLVISGGGVLRLSPLGSCAAVVPGRAIAVTLDDDTRVIPQKLDASAHPASDLPAAAFRCGTRRHTGARTASRNGDESSSRFAVDAGR